MRLQASHRPMFTGLTLTATQHATRVSASLSMDQDHRCLEKVASIIALKSSSLPLQLRLGQYRSQRVAARDCGGACALFPSYNMLALSSSTDLALVSSPTLTVTTTAGTTSQYSLSGLSGTNTMLNFGGLSTMSIKSAKFSGRTGSYSFSSPLYLG